MEHELITVHNSLNLLQLDILIRHLQYFNILFDVQRGLLRTIVMEVCGRTPNEEIIIRLYVFFCLKPLCGFQIVQQIRRNREQMKMH